MYHIVSKHTYTHTCVWGGKYISTWFNEKKILLSYRISENKHGRKKKESLLLDKKISKFQVKKRNNNNKMEWVGRDRKKREGKSKRGNSEKVLGHTLVFFFFF